MAESCARRIARGGWAEDRILHRCKFPIGPRNTWSNAAYPLAGLAAAWFRPGPSSIAFAALLTVLGVGSALYHGLKTKFANDLDWLGMFGVMSALVLHSYWPGTVMDSFLPMLLMGLTLGLWLFMQAHFDWMMALGTVASAGKLYFGPHRDLMWVGLLAFALAYLAWQLDKRGALKLWGHALWHILTAVAFFFLWCARGLQ